MINAAISDIPTDMTIAMLLCPGNYRSTYVGTGAYVTVLGLVTTKSRQLESKDEIKRRIAHAAKFADAD